MSLRTDYTEFEHIGVAEAERRAEAAGEFDALKRSFVTTASVSYGLTDYLQLGGTIGYYWGNEFIDAERTDEGVESSTADPEGLTDLYLTAKYRVLKGFPGNLSVIGGIKLPTGRDDVRLGNLEVLEPSSQPGTGAVDYQAGLSYSRFLTSRVTVDASVLYTFRTHHDGFKVGDRLDAGVAVAYRLTESIKDFPQVSVFGEVTDVWLQRDQGDEGPNPNSGGNALYLSPGVRVRFDPRVSLTVAPGFPVLQDLHGDQIESRFRLAVTFSYSF